jgi:hypothetical protein
MMYPRASEFQIEVNPWLILLACGMVLFIGLSAWYDALPIMALLCLAIVIGIFAFVVSTTKPVGLLYFLCLLIPFSQSVPLFHIAGRTMHIGFDTIVIGIILLGYTARMMVIGRAKYIIEKSCVWLFVWWGWNLCMLALMITRSSGISRSDAVFVFLRWSQYIPVFLLVLNTKLQPMQAKMFVKICVVAGSLMAAATVLEGLVIGVDITQVRGAGLISEGLFTEGSVANYNIVAAYLATVALLFAPFVLSAHKRRKWLGTLIVVFLLVGIWLTTSRSGLFAVMLGFFFLGLSYFPRTFIYSVITFGPLGLGSLWLFRDTHAVRNLLKLRYIPQALPMLLGASLESLGLPPTAGGGVKRLYLWGETLRFFAQSPLWGHGFRATRWSKGVTVYFTADNYYLEILADTGIIGLTLALLFFGTLYVSAVRLYRLARKRESIFLQKFSIGYLAAFVGLMMINLFAGMFMTQKIWGGFILLSAVLCNQLHRERRRQFGGVSFSWSREGV